jgi:hypothetical protein
MDAAKNRKRVGWVIQSGLLAGMVAGFVIYRLGGSGYYAFHGGFLSAIAVGWIVKRVLNVSMAVPAPVIDARENGFDPDETIVHHGPANHYKGFEAVGGRLFLTSKRLRFRSHKLNVQSHDESYPVDIIISVEPARTLGVVPNGVLVHLRDGRHERFVVGGRAEWVARLRAVTADARATTSRAPSA